MKFMNLSCIILTNETYTLVTKHFHLPREFLYVSLLVKLHKLPTPRGNDYSYLCILDWFCLL